MKTIGSPSASTKRVAARGSDAWVRCLLREMLDAAIASANPALLLPSRLPPPPLGRCIVVGAGKAAASMAATVEREWPEVDLSGCVAVPYGYGLDCRKIHVREAGHPVPDANSVSAAEEILAAVSGLTADDLVLALISGGGSATICLPAAGITLADKQLTNRLLLASGFDIRTMNAVRQHISAIKGGRLAAAAAPARLITYAISDIPGDDAVAIASGPTASFAPARDLDRIVEALGQQLPASVRELLTRPHNPPAADNAEPIRLIATAKGALAAAANVAKERHVMPVILGDAIEGEARNVGRDMARKVLEYSGPCVLLSGGETTVTVGKGKAGRGGRNTEFLLALINALDGRQGVWALAADTDGEDGSNLGAAGAIAGPDTLNRARDAGLDVAAALTGHDSGSFFASLDDLIVTGPTLTNVNDFRAILIMPQERG
jgi:glycerate 2-kinase